MENLNELLSILLFRDPVLRRIGSQMRAQRLACRPSKSFNFLTVRVMNSITPRRDG